MLFKLQDVIAISGAIQGLLLTIFLIRRRASQHLVVLVIMASIMLLGRGFYFHYPLTWPYQFVFLPDVIIFLFGPYLYFYFRSIAGLPIRYRWLHMIPAVLHLFAVAFIFQYTNQELRAMEYQRSLTLWYATSELVGIVSGITYITLSMLLVRKQVGVAFKKNQVQFLNVFIGLMYLSLSAWLLSFIQNYFFNVFGFLSYNMVWIFFPFVVHFLAYFSMSGSKKIVPPLKKETIRVVRDRGELIPIKDKLERLMQEEHLYRDAELTLKDLADKLSLTSNKTSWLLNQVYQESFNDFINRLRLAAFLELVESGEHYKFTILALANACGFNSKSTFNKVFKDKMNTTPSAYIRSRKV